jgi:hypothetical protein
MITGDSSAGRKRGGGMKVYDPVECYLHGFVLKQKDYSIYYTMITKLLRNTGRGTGNLLIRTGWQMCRPCREKMRLC